jgi:hypothetical protein
MHCLSDGTSYIVQNGTDFPAWYVFFRMVCIFQHDIFLHGMYCRAWYVFSSMVCIFQQGMYCPLYSICYLFIGMTGDNRKEIKKKCEIQSFSDGK